MKERLGGRITEGNERQFFDVRLDSTIMVESLQPVSAGVLKSLGARFLRKAYAISCRDQGWVDTPPHPYSEKGSCGG